MAKVPPKLNLSAEIQQPFNKAFEKIVTYHDTVRRMRGDMDAFSTRLETAAKQNEFINREYALSVHAKAGALLSLCKDEPSAEFVPAALAAIDYFLQEDDATPDFDDPFDGFVDDDKVLDAVIAMYGLEKKITAKLGGAA